MILASSKDNFIQLSNAHASTPPYVVFTVGSPTDVTITITDADNADGYKKTIVGSATANLTSSSFKTGSGVIALNLLECLKLNPIFYNVQLQSSTTVKAFIDTSIRYSISVSGNGITVGGTYSSYNAIAPSKMVVMMNANIDGEASTITLEKYNDNSLVSFNLTAPFAYTTAKTPIQANITAYQMYNSAASVIAVPYSTATIMPTTLTKFQDVDWSLYYDNQEDWHCLTNNENRYYNYGEVIGLSCLSDTAVSIRKSFYTNSGVFLETIQDNAQLIEQHGLRWDVFDILDLAPIENRYNKQVGYVNVCLYNSGGDTANVRYNIVPKCKENNEVFFLNELGGIDSFNFNNVKTLEMAIDENNTYFKNPIAPFTDSLEIEASLQKHHEVTHILSSHQIDFATAKWLGELQKTKYAFKYLSSANPKFMTIILDKFDININNDDNSFELELEYHDSDNKINV